MFNFFKISVLSFFIFFNSHLIFGQNINGVISSISSKQALPKASIGLLRLKDSSVYKTTIADTNGRFFIREVNTGTYIFKCDYIGYKTFYKTITVADGNNRLKIEMEESENMFGPVGVIKQREAVSQKSDTIEFSASNYKVNPDANVEDLVKKMPGVTVENGTIKAQGEDIKKVTVDGQDFFGEDAAAALKNLPAEIVSKIQVYDRMSDQSQFTGVDDGNSQKSLNIITKSGKNNGQFGKIYGGYGTNERWAGGGNVNVFTSKHRFSFIGMSNNINQQNFTSEDISGVLGTTSNARGGGRPGGNRGGFGGGASNFLVGQSNGINTTNSFGLNYTKITKGKLKITGSYFFNHSKNINASLSDRTYFLSSELNQFYTQSDTGTRRNFNHRLNARLEYNIDSSNSIIFTPSISFQNSDAKSLFLGITQNDTLRKLNQSSSNSNARSDGYNLNNSILWRHRFAKPGQTFSVNLNTSYNASNSNNLLNSSNVYFLPFYNLDDFSQNTDQLNTGLNISPSVSITQPLSKKSFIELNYNPSWNFSNLDKNTARLDTLNNQYTIVDSLLSNRFKNTTRSNKVGATYRYSHEKWSFNIGADYKSTVLKGNEFFPRINSFSRPFNNVLPNAMLTYQHSKTKSWRLFYRTNTQLPSINQLQNVVNNSNPVLLSGGNASLEQEFSHSIFTRYSSTNPKKGTNFFIMASYSIVNNYIGNNTFLAQNDTLINEEILLRKGSQITLPVNLSGNRRFRSFATYGFPIKKIKSVLNANIGQTISKIPTLINNNVNFSNTYNSSAGLVLASNISEKIDFNLSYNVNYNTVVNSLQSNLNNQYTIQFLNLKANWMPNDNWVLTSDVSNSQYNGLGVGFNQNIWLWNGGLGYKFLKEKRGEIKLSVFDILNQNRSINRTVSENYIEDNFTNVLTRFFMMTFTYQIRNFKSKVKTN
ncbi:MAG: outer membrane beta-barrel protein [Bacteroidota bacterium]|nr:outer membrane beta-barrel protein [Bacteroidota bacterium]